MVQRRERLSLAPRGIAACLLALVRLASLAQIGELARRLVKQGPGVAGDN